MDLTRIGLSKGESEIYLILLNYGQLQVSDIAKRTKISRPHVYDILNKLVTKGLVCYIVKESKNFYNIAGPEKLLDFIKEKEDFINNILPEINKIYKEQKQKSSFEVLEGIEGLKFVFNDILREKPKEWLADGGTSTAFKLPVIPEFLEIWHKKRINAGIKLRVIMNSDENSIERGGVLGKMPMTEVKFADTKTPSASTIYLYGDKIAIMIWSEKNPRAIIIEDSSLYEFFKNHFEESWKKSLGYETILKNRHMINFYSFIESAENSLDIMDICCIEPIHEGRAKIISLLNAGKKIRILISNPKSESFQKRVYLEEQFIRKINESRILFELKSALASLRDICHRVGSKKINLEVRFFDKNPKYHLINVDNKKLLYNEYSGKKGEYGSSNMSFILIIGDKRFNSVKDIFEDYWISAKKLEF